MATIKIKSSKPYTEKKVQGMLNGNALTDNITVGVKVYTNKELESIREEYSSSADSTLALRYLNQLQQLPKDLTISDAEFNAENIRLTQEVDKYNKEQEDKIIAFVKKHVAYIKNASLVLEDEAGKDIDLLIADTRDAKPIESLWVDGDEALVVLLDIYLDNPIFKDSLISTVTKLVFNTDFQNGKLGN